MPGRLFLPQTDIFETSEALTQGLPARIRNGSHVLGIF